MGVFDKFWSQPVSRDQYARLVSHALTRLGLVVTSYESASFSLECESCGTIYLGNGYEKYTAASPRDRDAAIEEFAVALDSVDDAIPEIFLEAKGKLMPAIRSAVYHPMVELMLYAKGQKYEYPALKPFTADLVINLAYDSERTIVIPAKSKLDRWHVSVDEIFDVALRNLRDVTGTSCVEEKSPGLYLINSNDGYDCSRMLMPELFSQLPLHGSPVAFAPDRDHLWIAGSEDLVALAMMIQAGEKSVFGAYSLSPNLFRLQDGEWSFWHPEEPGLSKSLNNLGRKRRAIDYNEQKELLEQIYERDRVDVFVASYTLKERASGEEIYSSSVWSRGIPTLLPRTNEIILLINQDPLDCIVVRWESVESLSPGLLRRSSRFAPFRYEAYEFPTEDQLAILRSASTRQGF